MPLSRIQIERFRGIPLVDLLVDDTTVFVGENGCGRSSLFRALALCLGTDAAAGKVAFARDDLRRDGTQIAGPIRIELEFREPARGAWKLGAKDPLRAVAHSEGDRRRIVVVVHARPSGAGVATQIRFRTTSGEVRAPGGEAAALDSLRRRFPALHVRRGILTTSWIGERDEAERAILAAVQRVGAELGDPHPHELLAAVEAARAIIQGVERHLGAPDTLPRWLATELGLVEFAGRRRAGKPPTHAGSSRSLGAILAAGVLLAARGPRRLAPDAEPILLLEDPEAHLHPMTLAMAWQLIARTQAQKLIATMSSELLAEFPLGTIRRLLPGRERLQVRQVGRRTLPPVDARKVRYHVRSRRGHAFFARCWLLVEGETEFWLLPQLARHWGCDFALEGIAVVEFAQCGVDPLIKLARDLGIQWHLLCDGDTAGRQYAAAAQRLTQRGEGPRRITQLPARDLEHLLFEQGFADVFHKVAGLKVPARAQPRRARHVIGRALARAAKPELALAILEAALQRDPNGLPAALRELFTRLTQLARRGEVVVS